MSTLDVTYPTWMDKAACADSDADFFPAPGHNTREAKAVCAGCPVRMACLTFALEMHIDAGVYGGLTPPERHQLGPFPYPCPSCGRLLRSESALPLHRARWCRGVRAA